MQAESCTVRPTRESAVGVTATVAVGLLRGRCTAFVSPLSSLSPLAGQLQLASSFREPDEPQADSYFDSSAHLLESLIKLATQHAGLVHLVEAFACCIIDAVRLDLAVCIQDGDHAGDCCLDRGVIETMRVVGHVSTSLLFPLAGASRLYK